MIGVSTNLNDFYGRVKDFFILSKDSAAVMRMLSIESRINCSYLEVYCKNKNYRREEIQDIFEKVDISSLKRCFETGEINTRFFSEIEELSDLDLEDDALNDNAGERSLASLISFLYVRITVMKKIADTGTPSFKKIRYNIRINNIVKAYICLLAIIDRHQHLKN